MKDTEALIQRLSREPRGVPPLPAPERFMAELLLICLMCGLLWQSCLGWRPDLLSAWANSGLKAELISLFALLLSSLMAGVLSMYPDGHQWPRMTPWPYVLGGTWLTFSALSGDAAWSWSDALDLQGLRCSAILAAVSFIPSAWMMRRLGQGAVVQPGQAGAWASLTGLALGGLVVRLHESNDATAHVMIWHDLPALLLAMAGAWLGRHLLKQ